MEKLYITMSTIVGKKTDFIFATDLVFIEYFKPTLNKKYLTCLTLSYKKNLQTFR